MKKLLLFVFTVLALVLPIQASATTKHGDYTSKDLKETLAEEKIELKNKNYSESKDQAIIYMFRGNGCGYCKAFLNYLNSISDEYGKKFKLVSFEVYNDPKNSELLSKFAYITEQDVGGVPFIVIGNKIFPGYSPDYNDKIKEAIDEEYNNKNKNNVLPDALKVTNEQINVPGSSEGTTGEGGSSHSNGNDQLAISDKTTIIIWNFVFTVISTSVLAVLILSLKKKIK